MSTHTNRLAAEKSPYLLQHQHNPVDWYPWGSEAFEKAAQEEKPIFLSIGYSTCHWCHVMERESFESEEVAAFLNAHFVSIKVDREERPDVDAIYITAVQAMSGSGGWPMSVFLTPERKPFYAGTYFPPQPAYGRPSFLQLLARIAELWQGERQALLDSATKLTEALQHAESANAGSGISRELADKTFEHFRTNYDRQYGGFGGAPKFPRPVQHDFLLNYWSATGIEEAKEMSLATLQHMALGGMYDHIGGGFHRYSVDRYWKVSHFEKMLYDQAQLLHSYLDAFAISGAEIYSQTARGIADYVLRDLTSPDGGFYSAEDADSEGVEGKFYAWTEQELAVHLGPLAEIALPYFGITDEGNFEHGNNVLHATQTIEEFSDRSSLDRATVRESIQKSLQQLFTIREKRIRPHLDDKVLTSWNGLMIGALARAGVMLGKPEYLDAATRAATFIWNTLRPEGALLHRWRDGEARFDAYLDTYAFLIEGYLSLYESTLESTWLARAIELQAEQDEHLYDEETHGYYMSREASDLIVRPKSDYDGAEPSGNSVSVLNLLRLGRITDRESYLDRARETTEMLVSRVERFPYAVPKLMVGVLWQLEAPQHLLLKGETTELLHTSHEYYLPRCVRLAAKDAQGELGSSIQSDERETAAFFCKAMTCELPVSTNAELAKLLAREARMAKD